MTTDAQSALAQVREALSAGPTPGAWVRREKHSDEQWGVEIRTITGGRPVIVDGCATPATAGYIAACSPANISAILAHVEAQAFENEQLREMLARLYAGSDLYCDDGELQDGRFKPFIDFKRDSVAEIRYAMVERNERKKQR